jgi:Ca2+/Na+ antiporter
MPVYLYGAILCFLALKKRYNIFLYTIGLLVYTGYAVYLVYEKDGVLTWLNKHNTENILQSMKATKPWIEETREFLGLLILIVALIINMIWLFRSKRVTYSVSNSKSSILQK